MNDKNLGSQKNKLKEIKRTPELRFKGFSDDWEQCKLGKVFKTYSGMTPLRSDISNFKNPEVPWIKTTDLKNSDITSNDEKISAKAANKLKVLPVNTVLIAMYGGFNQIGRTGLLTYPATINQALTALEPNDSISPYFLLTELNYRVNDWKKFAASSRKDPNITKRDIDNFMINFPTQQEQQKIGSFFQQLDNTITLHQRKLDKLKQLKQGYLQQLFPKPGETVPKIRFANFEGEWEERKLKQLGEIQTGNTPSTKDSSNYAKNGILWVTPTDIDSLIISDTAKKLSEKGQTKARIAKAGSILVTSIASIGKNALAKTDMGFNQQINSLTPSSENDSYFLLTQSEKWSEMMQRNAAAGTMQIVNKSEFSNIVTEVPKLDEQGQIGNFFAKLDQTITLQLSKINKLKSIKQALLQKMFI